MRIPFLLPLAVFVSACSPEPADVSGSPGTAPGGDTSAEDSGSGDDSVDGEDSGTDTTPLTLTYDGDASGLGIAFVGPHLGDSWPSDVWLAFDAAGTTQTIELAPPPDSDIANVDMLGGASGAVYFLALYDDTDGSGARDPGEAWVSAGPMAIFMAGTVPDQLASFGITPGWNVLAYPETVLYPLSGVPMKLHRPHNDITVGGTVEGLPGDAAAGMLLYPYVGMPPATPLYDEPLDGLSWSISLSGPPPSEHYIEGSPWMALEQPLAYVDVAPSGFSRNDTGYSYACIRGNPVYLQWYATDDLSTAFSQLYYGMGAGWTAAVPKDGNLVPLDPTDYTSLVADGSCI